MSRKAAYKPNRCAGLRVLLAVALALCAAAMWACSSNPYEERGAGRVFDGTFRLFVTMGEDDPRSVGARHFAELVEQYSGGELHCDVQTGPALGSDVDLIKGMMRDSGEADMLVVSSAFFAEQAGIPQLEISAMPYLLTDFETAWAFADSDIMEEFEAELPRQNIRVLSHFCGGFRCITNSKRPIETPDDLKGLVIRTPSGSLVMDMLFALDAKAMPLPFDELNDALKKGYYDGEENPPSIIYYNGLYEAQEYLSMTNHAYMMQNLTVAESIWRQLSEEERDIVLKAAQEATRFERELVVAETNSCIEKLEEEGMKVNYPDLALFTEVTESLREDESRVYEDDYARVKNWLDEYASRGK